MRYWHPLTNAAIAELEGFAPEDVVLLPLYPQFSKTTTQSSVNEWNRRFHTNGWRPSVHLVREFYEDPAYIDSVVHAIDACLAGYEHTADLDMVFSAHSVPVAVIDAGDPYQRQIERTVDLVWDRGKWPARRHICYQSKVGASKWLQPSMHATVKRLADAGSKHVLVVPISFVSDHVETLHEIDIEHREQAHTLGIADYRMMPGLNDNPNFIEALGKLVRERLVDRASAPLPT
jgi:protoporphyrin/coproporphyrin ferrochelatase